MKDKIKEMLETIKKNPWLIVAIVVVAIAGIVAAIRKGSTSSGETQMSAVAETPAQATGSSSSGVSASDVNTAMSDMTSSMNSTIADLTATFNDKLATQSETFTQKLDEQETALTSANNQLNASKPSNSALLTSINNLTAEMHNGAANTVVKQATDTATTHKAAVSSPVVGDLGTAHAMVDYSQPAKVNGWTAGANGKTIDKNGDTIMYNPVNGSIATVTPGYEDKYRREGFVTKVPGQ